MKEVDDWVYIEIRFLIIDNLDVPVIFYDASVCERVCVRV